MSARIRTAPRASRAGTSPGPRVYAGGGRRSRDLGIGLEETLVPSPGLATLRDLAGALARRARVRRRVPRARTSPSSVMLWRRGGTP